jgi:hypothetical protein
MTTNHQILGASQDEAEETHRRVLEANKPDKSQRFELGRLLWRMLDWKLYRELPRPDGLGPAYSRWSEYVQAAVSMSVSEASDLIFVSTELLQFIEKRFSKSEVDLAKVKPAKLRIVVPILRRLVRQDSPDNPATVQAWLARAMKLSARELLEAKNREQGLETPEPVEFVLSELEGGNIKLEAVVSPEAWAYYYKKRKISLPQRQIFSPRQGTLSSLAGSEEGGAG